MERLKLNCDQMGHPTEWIAGDAKHNGALHVFVGRKQGEDAGDHTIITASPLHCIGGSRMQSGGTVVELTAT